MFSDQLYEVIGSVEAEASALKALIRLRKDHPVFKGHFPGQPVLPGVCMLQIIKEMLQQQVSRDLTLVSASGIKFLSMINPGQQDEVAVEITWLESNGMLEADASLRAAATDVFKIRKAIYR